MRKKVSVYVEGELWERFKRHAAAMGTTASGLLEELMKEELGDHLIEALSKLAGSEGSETDFKPVEPGSPVSDLVGEMRRDRERRLLHARAKPRT
jgi:hypothetical protein